MSTKTCSIPAILAVWPIPGARPKPGRAPRHLAHTVRMAAVRRVVLVTSPNSRRATRLPRVRAALRRYELEVVDELPVDQLSRLPDLVRDRADRTGTPPLVVAAGGGRDRGAVG